MTTNIELFGKLATKNQYLSKVKGGYQPSEPIEDYNRIKIYSDNSNNEVITNINANGISFIFPSNDGSHLFKCQNNNSNQFINVKSGPLNPTPPLSIGIKSQGNNPGQKSTGVGSVTGVNNQGQNSTAIGSRAGEGGQGDNSVAIGNQAGYSGQGNNSVAIGTESGQIGQGINCVSIGFQCGRFFPGDESVAIGTASGNVSQGENCIAIGHSSSRQNQGNNSTACGSDSAGGSGIQATCIGKSAAAVGTNNDVVCIGHLSGAGSNLGPVIDQGEGTVCIGAESIHQGTYGISLGYKSGFATGSIDNAFYISMNGYGTVNNRSSINPATTLNWSSNSRLLVINRVVSNGEIRLINGMPNISPLLPGINTKKITIDTTTGKLGYNP